MKLIRLLLSILTLIISLSSCSLSKKFTERKYRPGFFIERSGKIKAIPENSIEPKSVTENALVKTDSFSTDSTVKDAIVINQEVNRSPEIVSFSKKENAISPAENKIPPGKAPPVISKVQEKIAEQEEADIINSAFGLAIAAFILFFGVIALAFISPFFLWGWALALAASIWGFVLARRIKRMHVKGEPYPGKWKVIVAYIIGIIGIVLGSIGAAFGLLLVGLILS